MPSHTCSFQFGMVKLWFGYIQCRRVIEAVGGASEPEDGNVQLVPPKTLPGAWRTRKGDKIDSD